MGDISWRLLIYVCSPLHLFMGRAPSLTAGILQHPMASYGIQDSVLSRVNPPQPGSARQCEQAWQGGFEAGKWIWVRQCSPTLGPAKRWRVFLGKVPNTL